MQCPPCYNIKMNQAFSFLSHDEEKTLSDYCENHFVSYNDRPCEDLSFLDFWKAFISSLEEKGAEKAINTMLIPNLPLRLKDASGISAQIYKSVAGLIPVVGISDSQDFENLTVNLIHKGKRPENIGSTGASFVYGKKTRFIILSKKPYSNVSAKSMGLGEEEWLEKSMKIRLEHECTHFFTKKFFGVSMNHLHDELIADFFGLLSAFGSYKAEYFEYFMGIKGSEGSRLSCYIPDCSKNLLSALKEKASKAAAFLEELQKEEDFSKLSHSDKIRFLCQKPLLKLD